MGTLEKAALWNQSSVNFCFHLTDFFFHLAFENDDIIHTNIFETMKAIFIL